jgi:hypothetical protein
LNQKVPEHQEAAAKPHHDKIDKHDVTALNHAGELNKELKKSKPDDAKVKEHAKATKEATE